MQFTCPVIFLAMTDGSEDMKYQKVLTVSLPRLLSGRMCTAVESNNQVNERAEYHAFELSRINTTSLDAKLQAASQERFDLKYDLFNRPSVSPWASP